MMRSAVWGSLVAVVLAGCSALGSYPTPIPTPLDRVVKIDPAKVPAGIAAYGTLRGSPAYGATVKDALKLHNPDDVSRMVGAPEDLKAYLRQVIEVDTRDVIASLASEGKTLQSEECSSAVEIKLWGAASAVATGRERGCGRKSADVIWAKTDGQWRRVARMQGGWDCVVLNRYRVPAVITGSTCWYDEYKTRAYYGPRS